MSDDPSPTLFDAPEGSEPDAHMPLAARMRPRTLDEYVGQAHVVGPGTMLHETIRADHVGSMIFWGPPGCGKSTLALVIAGSTSGVFETLSAVTTGVPDLRKALERAADRRRRLGKQTILFVDEIHRWNKAQQDALLPHVESGAIALIGATTENPYFEVNSPLLSRCRVFRLEQLSDADVRTVVSHALGDRERGLGTLGLELAPDAMDHLASVAGGDARVALNALETAAQDAGRRCEPVISLRSVEEALQQRAIAYDQAGDAHYDTISAFIKSVRGSDVDAAVYWLAKMLLAGEEPRFIARRLVILASEDIGNADPMGLVLAQAAADAVQFVGMPEAKLVLSQATTFLAAANKSNAATVAITRAQEDIRTRGAAVVPMHLRNAPHPGLAAHGHGKGYLYPHDFAENWVEQEYLPKDASSGPYYVPTGNGAEVRIAERMARRRALRKETDSS